MTYRIACRCGRRFDVLLEQGGQVLNCSCGAGLDVPSEMKLQGIDQRRSPNDARIISEREQQREQTSNPIVEGPCIQCSSQTDAFLDLTCECERVQVSSGEPSWSVAILWYALMLLLGRIVLSFGDNDPATVNGRETVYHTPIALCRNCFSLLPKPSNLVIWISRLLIIAGVLLCFISRLFLSLAFIGLVILLNNALMQKSRYKEINRLLSKKGDYQEIIHTYPNLVVHEGRYVETA